MSDISTQTTIRFVVHFWAQALISPLGPLFRDTGTQGKLRLVSAATIVPILFLAFFALGSYSLLLVGGFFLGIAGTAFAVGVPFVNAWFPPERRCLAVGAFGAGMGGTAMSAPTTVKLFTNVRQKAPFLIATGVLDIVHRSRDDARLGSHVPSRRWDRVGS
ncbi:MAG: MFS transporter [Mycobacteriaceae bacterium]